MISLPSTHSRTVSSDTVRKVYVSVYGGCTEPVQRAEKLSVGMASAGEPWNRQAKLSVGSVRVTAGDPWCCRDGQLDHRRDAVGGRSGRDDVVPVTRGPPGHRLAAAEHPRRRDLEGI